MTYVFRGHFWGELAPGFTEPLAGIRVRLYRYRGTKYGSSLAVTDPKDTMAFLDEDRVSAKASSLLAETTTNQAGHYVFVLDEQRSYRGEAFDIDLFLANVPGRKSQLPRKPLQITFTTMKPRWQLADSVYTAEWEYCLSANFWCEIRSYFDAWVICGRVLTQVSQQPVSGAQVTAFDADWLQDDELGSALTDAEGKFRIDYERADFSRTLLSPIVNIEEGGPDLYFKINRSSGTVLLNEPKSQGHTPGRENACRCFFIEFSVLDDLQ